LRKLVFATAAAAVGLGLPIATAGAAAAADGDQPLVTVANGACVAPWLWQLPAVTVVTGPESYANCDGPAVPHEHGALVGVLDDSCILPWDWEGPLDVGDAVLHPMQTGHYAACDHVALPEGVQPPAPQDTDGGIAGLDLIN
jgi:hypothetical protein